MYKELEAQNGQEDLREYGRYKEARANCLEDANTTRPWERLRRKVPPRWCKVFRQAAERRVIEGILTFKVIGLEVLRDEQCYRSGLVIVNFNVKCPFSKISTDDPLVYKTIYSEPID